MSDTNTLALSESARDSAIQASHKPSNAFTHSSSPQIIYNGPIITHNVGYVGNASFGDNYGQIEQRAPVVQKGSTDPEGGLKYLIANMAPGAIHDSNERCDAPKCMEETRVAVQEDIMSWISAGDQDSQLKRIMWVTGPAGTGKTAILGTIADACKEKGSLAASFFFSASAGSANRRTKKYFVPTLAFQLMGHCRLKGSREQLLSSIAQDQAILFSKNLKEQFITMVLNPLRSAREVGGDTVILPQVIVIDGLDECEAEQYHDPADLSNSRAHVPIRRKEDDQREILSLLLSAASDPSFPFRILIASRPELSIRDFFATDGDPYTRELFLDSKYDPDADILLFYDAKFSTICRRLGLPNNWPGKEVKLTLVRNASGQFIYAATVMRYIEGSPHLTKPEPEVAGRPPTPHRRLEHILSLTPSTRTANSSHNPLEALDALYHLLLENCPDPDLSMKWLRAVTREYTDPLNGLSPVWLLRLVLEASPGEEHYALGSLSSLLPTQIPEERLQLPYTFYHKSFLDFMVDPTRCGEKYLTEAQFRDWVTRRFFQTLDRHLIAPVLLDLESYSKITAWPGFSTRAVFRIAEPDILSCDLQKWATALAEEQTSRQESKWLILGMLYGLHYQCPWYRCHSTCKRCTGIIITILRTKGWKVPSTFQNLRKVLRGFVRYTDLEPPPP
ncbi:hypothetical protein D9611_006861 [Ephemerocybe angulata]|uniref:NACHT domain-containing protein n=1 Tax=Ephemerocybe angulata TaxID=980116 RepID=A0A8H5EVN8_9AGAR|nr:hypothetical protein D9611_006861 [Tulosesus angulatus]